MGDHETQHVPPRPPVVSDPGPEFPVATLEAVQPVPILSVTVDFNELLRDVGEPGAFVILGNLKDLLA